MALSKCPNCGAAVSQFAAGCAICGEDLVAARRHHAERQANLPRLQFQLPGWLGDATGPEWILGVILVLIAFGLPVIGIFIAGFIAVFAHRSDEVVQRNFALVAMAVAFLMVMLISFVPQEISDLLPWIDASGPFPA